MAPIISDLLLPTSYRGSEVAGQLARLSSTLAPQFNGRSAMQSLGLRGAQNPLHCHDSGIRVATVCEEIAGGTNIGRAGES